MVYYIGTMPYSSDLYHHGVKGQKWGVRRYQNSDGTLTEEGKRRYASESLNSNSHDLLRRIAARDYGPIKNSAIRGKLEEHWGKDSSNKSKYEAQKQKNIDYEKYTAKTSTGKLVVQRLLMGGFAARKYREARARGAGRIRSVLSSSFFLTPVGFIATKVSEKKHYGHFVHSDIYSSDELFHFGIKGQKWGIRRYENPDGTLTQVGKERYQRNLHKEARRDAQRKSDADAAYGSGAGTRRKLIDKEINEKLKNKDYAKHYERAKKEVDVSKSLKRAESLHKHSGDFERGQRLSDRGRTVSNTILRSIGSSAATAVTSHLIAQVFGGGDKLTSSIIYATGGLTIASTLGSGARDAYQINYYERNKKF